MFEPEDDVPPLSPVRVAAFILFLGLVAYGGWRFWRAQAAVAAVAEASKDYRKLFPARSVEPQGVPASPATAAPAAASGMALLKIDDDMRVQARAKAISVPAPAATEEKAPPPPQAEPPATAPAAAPAAPTPKAFVPPKLNSGGFSNLNGGAGIRPQSDKK